MTTHHPRATVTEQQRGEPVRWRKAPQEVIANALQGHDLIAASRCACGWTPQVGDSVWRAFDRHLAAVIVAECLPGDAEGGL